MIKLLDCTLRDGGYVNNWEFGKDCIFDIKNKLLESNIDIVELGFLKDEKIDPGRTVFSSVDQLIPLIGKKKENTLYAAMIDVQGRIPIEMIEDRTSETIDVIRVIIWKRLLKEDFKYCESIVKKGYKLCVQPARVEQYNDEEFVAMLKMFEVLDPMAVYVVDSWGILSVEEIMHYARILDKHLSVKIAIGYHGHNNLQQAFGASEAFIKEEMKRDKIIDSSIYGIGRGAGNLCTEVIAQYLNNFHGKKYNVDKFIEIYDLYLERIFDSNSWGYSMPLFLTALHRCNPEYGIFFSNTELSNTETNYIINSLSEEQRIRFDKIRIDEMYSKIMEKR